MILSKAGLQSADTAELFFDNCIVPKANQLGEANKGFKYMMMGLTEECVVSSVVFMARAQRVFDITLEFVKERKAFGKSIGQFPADGAYDGTPTYDVVLDHCAAARVVIPPCSNAVERPNAQASCQRDD